MCEFIFNIIAQAVVLNIKTFIFFPNLFHLKNKNLIFHNHMFIFCIVYTNVKVISWL